MGSKIRIGIDVGGTFTHAVAIDNRTLEVVRTACFPTTHTAAEGVALGVQQCLEKLVREENLSPDDVVFVAHSTTQATNALLEGDVARVGLIGIAGGVTGIKAKKELAFESIKITDACEVPVSTAFFTEDDFQAGIPVAMQRLTTEGAKSFVVAQPFAVDDPRIEQEALAIFVDKKWPATATHQISGLYGLRARARTSIVNASILPKMLEVARNTRAAVENLEIRVPLMIMRSDGGVMDAAVMGQKPILTILSGPAAGVSAAILYERISNGLFVEVGGTSTDISLILNGHPQRKNAVVGGHPLYLKTLDVRTVGVAGGSLPRVRGSIIADVGPRSAHIAGLEYACFMKPEELEGARLVTIAPLKSDAPEYAVLEMTDRRRVAITCTCAANCLGRVGQGDYALGNAESAKIAFDAMAESLGGNAAEIAERVLALATQKLETVCANLVKEYECSDVQLTVVGGGGGASVLVPHLAEKLHLQYKGARNAPVISAIGVGLALMKETIEKSVINPTEEDIRLIRSEAIKSLAAMGCDPATVEVQVETDRKKNVLRAVGTGASALVSQKSAETVTPDEAEKIARDTLGMKIESMKREFMDGTTFVFSGRAKGRGFLGVLPKELHPVVVVDGRGIARLALKNGRVVVALRADASRAAAAAIELATTFGDAGAIVRPVHLVYGGRVIDLSKAGEPEHIKHFAALEINEHTAFDEFCFVIAG